MSTDRKSLNQLVEIGTAKDRKLSTNATCSFDSSSVASKCQDHDISNKAAKYKSSDEFVAGLTAALMSTTALFPINKLIFRQMASGQRATTAAGLMRNDGLRYLYRGILPPLIQKMVSVSTMFTSFDLYKRWADNKFPNAPIFANLITASLLTGATEAVFTPLERVQMLLQDRKYHKNYKNTVDALRKLRQFGIPEYYRGLTCVFVRNGPSNILFFGLKDEIREYLPGYKLQIDPSNHTSDRKHGQPSHLSPQKVMLYNFLSGAILGMFISTLFYPLSVVRTRIQTRAPGTEFLTIVKAFGQVYVERDRQFTKLFRGCLINIMRQFVSWGMINCSHEFMLDQLHSIRYNRDNK